MRISPPAILALAALSLSACASVNEAVNGPQLQPMAYPAQLVPAQQTYAPAMTSASPNSLWRTGAKAFFKDQRARHVGDILTVTIDIDDKAQTQNTSSHSRDNSYSGSLPSVFGLESSLGKILPSEYNPSAGLSNNGSNTFTGTGSVNRSEKISLTVAAIVTAVLPNGNLIVQGSQEVRTNREVRELIVSGIVNPQDISSANIIKHTQLAEARISYGGRGDVSRAQAAPVSQNLMEKFSPF